MRKSTIVYAVLWLLTIVAFSLPWYSTDGNTFTGWNFVIPFSATYLLGILLGLIVLITKRWAFGLTILAGILMILGIVGAGVGGGITQALSSISGQTATAEGGIGFAFVISLVYLVGGAVLGKRMEQQSEKPPS
jgi:hypothetical protein